MAAKPRPRLSSALMAHANAPRANASPAGPSLDDVEVVARIGSYAMDVAAGRWVSSPGLDAILGIGAAFDRSVDGWAALIHPDDREAMLAYFAHDVLGRGQPFDRQYRILRLDTGEERWVAGRGRVERDAAGRPIWMLGTIADITDDRRTHEALVASERRYAAIFEGTIEAILIAEQQTRRFRYVNGAASTFLGYSRDELTSLTVVDIHPPEARPGILERFASLVNGAGISRAVPCLRKDGRVVLADIKASPVEIDGVACIVGFFSDVTERKLAVDLLADREARLQLFLDQMPGMIWSTDTELRCTSSLGAGLASLGLGPNQIVGTHLYDFAGTSDPSDPAIVAHRQALLGTGSSYDAVFAGRDYVVRVEPLRRPDGTIQGTLGISFDVTERERGAQALRYSEEHYRALVEQAADGILVSDRSGRYVEANPAICRMLGYTREEILATYSPDLAADDDTLSPEDMGDRLAATRIGTGLLVERRYRRRDGTSLPVEVSFTRLPDGRLQRNIRDISARLGAEQALRDSERNLAEAQRIAHIGSWDWDLVRGVTMRSDELHRIFGVEPGSMGLTPEAFLACVHPDDRARVQSAERAAINGAGRYAQDYRAVWPDGRVRFIHDEGEVLRDPSGAPARMVGFVQDVTETAAAEAERTRLVSAIEQASDSVLIADLAGTIEYVNPGFERISGYRREEAIGRNPRLLKSGRQSASFYRALWRRLARGQSWTGTLTNRRKDGSLYEVEATLSPIRGRGGEVSGYVGVERDVTAVRAAESALAAEFRERARVAAALARLQPSPTPEETAADICSELLALPGIDIAAIFDFAEPGRATTLAAGGPDGLPFRPGWPIPAARAAYLFERGLEGSWSEAWRLRPEDGSYGEAMTRVGIKASAFAPIRNGEGLLGLVAVGTCDESYARHLIDHLPAVSEFAATASALLSSRLERVHRSDLAKGRIGSILADRGFGPVFQPIFALASAAPVGYEALTRFTDGTPPDRMIAEAHTVGLGSDMELATMAAALLASEALPADAWLSLNVSPGVIRLSDELGILLTGQSRRIVLEVTEHVEIDDYPAVRRAVDLLGPTVSLAVDDAGSGFASLRHVVELRPQFLKLDISLVRGVDRDLTRQAMIAGLAQFAERAHCEVIAEGIETAAELSMLRELGVQLGQGFLLGRPTPASPDTVRTWHAATGAGGPGRATD